MKDDERLPKGPLVSIEEFKKLPYKNGKKGLSMWEKDVT
jgi:hypothetical protein